MSPYSSRSEISTSRQKDTQIVTWTLGIVLLAMASSAVYLLFRMPRYASNLDSLRNNQIGLSFAVANLLLGIWSISNTRKRAREVVRFMKTPAFWRGVLYLLFGSFLLTLVFPLESHSDRVFRTYLSGGLLLFQGMLIGSNLLEQRLKIGPLRWLDLLCFNATIAIILLEGTLQVASMVSNHPIFMRYNSRLERFRPQPHQKRMGYECNSMGYYDTEFQQRKPEETYRIVALGDSFAQGIVPYPYNFLTLTEEGLNKNTNRSRNWEIYNMGVNGTNPKEYRYLYLTEGQYYKPDLVLICFYMGNDFRGSIAPKFFDRNRWYLYFLPKRWFEIRKEAQARNVDTSKVGGELEQQDPDPPHVHDYRLEKPSYSVERHLRIEREWLKSFSKSGRSRSIRKTLHTLREINQIARSNSARTALLLIPDELQVNDSLYQEVLDYFGLDPNDFDLDEPGKILAQFCREEGIECLDLAQTMRKGQKELDRTYHLRDMHWNANGNRVASEALIPFIRKIASPRSP